MTHEIVGWLHGRRYNDSLSTGMAEMTTRNRLLVALVGVFCVQSFAGEKGLNAGDMDPDLVGRDIHNHAVRLTSFRDKVVVVSFFATWCEPCRKELPMLEALQRVGADKGLQVIAVNWKEDRE